MRSASPITIACLLMFGTVALTGCGRKPSAMLDVPFAAQSPYGIWDALHEEACEEMSLIMVRHFIDGTPLDEEIAEREVQQMVAWETANGYGVDVTTAELGAIARAMFGYHYLVLNDVTADMLRDQVAAGTPVIIPVAGRALGNPFFNGEAPFYHMLVVTGYNEKGFITNEPGSIKGKEYVYTEEVLMNALHDWTGVKEEIATGPKNALIIRK